MVELNMWGVLVLVFITSGGGGAKCEGTAADRGL
jgi:hypothetical protein